MKRIVVFTLIDWFSVIDFLAVDDPLVCVRLTTDFLAADEPLACVSQADD